MPPILKLVKPLILIYMVEMNAHAVIVVDLRGVIQTWSEGAEKLFGYDAESAVGQSLELIIPESYRDRHWAAFRAALERGSLSFDPAMANIPVAHQDGTISRFPGHLSLLRDAKGEAVGAIGVFSADDGSGSTLPDLQ